MSRPNFHPQGLKRAAHLLGAVPFFFLPTSCTPPDKKPIPPLSPSSVVAAEKSADTPPAPAPPAKVTRMPLGNLYQLVQKNAALIYDVRPAIAYKMGHIPGAINWPKKKFEQDFAKHEPRIRSATTGNTPVVVYCTDLACPDGIAVATALADRGYSASVLQGGYEAWKIAAE